MVSEHKDRYLVNFELKPKVQKLTLSTNNYLVKLLVHCYFLRRKFPKERDSFSLNTLYIANLFSGYSFIK